MRVINKIIAKDGRIQIKATDSTPKGYIFHPTADTFEPAAPSFYRAIADLGPVAVDICELPPAWAEGVEVTGVSIAHLDDGQMGVVFSCKKTLASNNSPMVFNTPLKMDAPLNGSLDYSMCLSDDAVKAIDKMMTEAQAFLDGKRAQMELPLAVAEA